MKEKTLKQFENIQKNKTGKLHYLSNILRIFKLQNYLESPLTKEHRSFLSKIRISVRSLNIETGRYNSTPREQRLCKFCPSSVEDEKHFILHCPKYMVLSVGSGASIDPRRRVPVNNLIYFISLLYAYLLLIHIYVMYYNYIVLS